MHQVWATDVDDQPGYGEHGNADLKGVPPDLVETYNLEVICPGGVSFYPPG
jgi:hypothetical protein